MNCTGRKVLPHGISAFMRKRDYAESRAKNSTKKPACRDRPEKKYSGPINPIAKPSRELVNPRRPISWLKLIGGASAGGAFEDGAGRRDSRKGSAERIITTASPALAMKRRGYPAIQDDPRWCRKAGTTATKDPAAPVITPTKEICPNTLVRFADVTESASKGCSAGRKGPTPRKYHKTP